MIVVFTGPTISAQEAEGTLPVRYAPPASQGDIYTAARERVAAIGLIDGYFERVPAVWHKEILWAMSRGVRVFGASSMGALRAAELDVFGMVGVGAIYEAFRDGDLEDDDEVAIAHASGEIGFAPLSEAMVNVRATVRAAVADGVISPETCGVLETTAKSLHFPDRRYERILRVARNQGGRPAELVAFRRWVIEGRVDQKRTDAIAMLELMRSLDLDEIEPQRVHYSFQNTAFWQTLVNEVERRPLEDRPGAETLSGDGVLDELRLLGPDQYAWVRERATVRLLALELALDRGIASSDESSADMLNSLRLRQGLGVLEALTAWQIRQGLTVGALERLLHDEVKVDHVRRMISRRLNLFIRDQLKVESRYAKLEARSRDKGVVLASRGLDEPTLEDAGVSEQALLDWYRETSMVAASEPVENIVRSLDFRDQIEFQRAVLREYCFLRATEG